MSLPPLAYIAFFSIVLPFMLSIIFWRRFQDDKRPLIILYGAYSGFLGIQYSLAIRGINNLWTSHIYELVELPLILLMYRMWISSKDAKNIYMGVVIVYAGFWIASKIFLESFDGPTFFASVISRIFLVAGSLYVLFEITSADSDRSLMVEPKFWFAAGFLAGAAGDLMFYAFQTFIVGFSFENAMRVFSIHWSVTIISNFMVTIGILCKPRLRTSGGHLELAR